MSDSPSVAYTMYTLDIGLQPLPPGGGVVLTQGLSDFYSGDPGRIQTFDLLLRRQTLYSAELRGHELSVKSGILRAVFTEVNPLLV